MNTKAADKVGLLKSLTWLNHSKYYGFRAFHILDRDPKTTENKHLKKVQKWTKNGPQICGNGSQRPCQKNIYQNDAKNDPKVVPKGVPRAVHELTVFICLALWAREEAKRAPQGAPEVPRASILNDFA